MNIIKYSGLTTGNTTLYTVPAGKSAKVHMRSKKIHASYTEGINRAYATDVNDYAYLKVGDKEVIYANETLGWKYSAICDTRNPEVGTIECLSGTQTGSVSDPNTTRVIRIQKDDLILAPGETITTSCYGSGSVTYNFLVIEQDL